MAFRFDHAIIAVHDLETAMTDYRRLGFTVFYGGEHTGGMTHNALICFQDDSYLELLAPTGKLPEPGAAVSFSRLLQGGEGLTGFALFSDDLAADVAAMRARGVQVNEVREGGRRRTDGVELRWRTAMIEGSVAPFFIEDLTPRSLRVPDDPDLTAHANGAAGVSRLLVRETERDAAGFRAILGVAETGHGDGAGFALGTVTLQVVAAAPGRPSLELALRAPKPAAVWPGDTVLLHGAALSLDPPKMT